VKGLFAVIVTYPVPDKYTPRLRLSTCDHFFTICG